jgi:hypothetical protein
MTGRSRSASSEKPFGLSQARWLKALMSSPANQCELRSFRGFPSSLFVAMCLTPDLIMLLFKCKIMQLFGWGPGPEKSCLISNYPAVKNDKGATEICKVLP